MLNPEAVEEFKQLCFKERGIKLTNEQAIDMGTNLKRLVKVVYGPNLPTKWKSKEVDTNKAKEVR